MSENAQVAITLIVFMPVLFIILLVGIIAYDKLDEQKKARQRERQLARKRKAESAVRK